MANFAIPIIPVKTVSGNQPKATRKIEYIGSTFKAGTPVAVDSVDGGVKVWGAAVFNGTQGSIVGISYEAASNLGATGRGAPLPMQPVVGVGSAITFGSVPNQSSAVNIPHGAPFNDGRVGFFAALQDTIFSAALGNAGAAAIPTATDVGYAYSLSLDTNGYWYVNKTVTTAVLTVVGLDLRDYPAAGTRVLFTFLPGVIDLVDAG